MERSMAVSRIFVLIAFLAGVISAGPALADFDAGLTAYERNDYTAALKEWLAAAEKGDPHAQHMLGFLYANGRGVPIDPEATVRWWTKAAEQGFPPAQFTLGSLYRKGLGVRRDADLAALWIGRAADAGYPDAQHAYGLMHAAGEGVPADLSMAFMWLDLAADTRGLPSGTYWRDVDPFLSPAQRLEADQLRDSWQK